MTIVIQRNQIFSNSFNLILGSGAALSDRLIILPRLDVLVEDNTIIGGGVGVTGYAAFVADGGRMRFFRNRIALQREEPLTGGRNVSDLVECDPFCSWHRFPWEDFSHGIVLNAIIDNNQLKAFPVQPKSAPTLEFVDNIIEDNEGWAITFNHPFAATGIVCNITASKTILVQITGKNNRIINNGKGSLCPGNYPWPQGFLR